MRPGEKIRDRISFTSVASTPTIRIATYNVHKCRGVDRRVDLERIALVIERLEADVVALQEILHGEGSNSQVRFLSERLNYKFSFGENRVHRGAPYGNATLSRLPIVSERNYDITWKGRERRGCLRTDIRLRDSSILHVFNVHMGTSYFERPHQARLLLGDALSRTTKLAGPRVVVGDFNEWTRGIATALMHGEFASVDARLRKRTFPGILPLFQLDHFYFDRHLKLEKFEVVRGPLAKIASDHLPLVADFSAKPSPQ
jgi:endonuclease/exonuclease/phosphatase family metal-dependent hydrolase